MNDSLIDAILAVLEAHAGYFPKGSPRGARTPYVCQCGHQLAGLHGRAHRAHLAAEIRKAIPSEPEEDVGVVMRYGDPPEEHKIAGTGHGAQGDPATPTDTSAMKHPASAPSWQHVYTVDAYLHGVEDWPCVVCGQGHRAHDCPSCGRPRIQAALYPPCPVCVSVPTERP